MAGAFGDLGTLLPLAVLLIKVNGLNPTVTLGLVGLAYVLAGLYYRIPMAVQPLKSFSALAIAAGLGVSVIAAGSLLMGAALLVLGLAGAAGWITRIVPKSLVRGIQLGAGIILVIAGGRALIQPLVVPWVGWVLAGVSGALLLATLVRRVPAALLVTVLGVTVGISLGGFPPLGFGPVAPSLRFPTGTELGQASLLLVLPQLPLTLANSVVAARDVATTYFGGGAARVTPRALCVGLGVGNLAAGLLGGMPICHGSGGITAHHAFGARTGGAVVFLGSLLLVVSMGFGPMAGDLCRLMPGSALGALMIYVGTAHVLLVRDVRGWRDWIVVLGAGLTGGLTRHNGYGLVVGIFLFLLGAAWSTAMRRRSSPGDPTPGSA